jgi:hypothetical protein
MFKQFEQWLLKRKAALEEQDMCRINLREQWMDRLTRKTNNEKNDRPAFVLDLASQCEAFQAEIFARPKVNNTTLMSTSFSRLSEFVFQKMFDFCLHGGSSNLSVLPAAWRKNSRLSVLPVVWCKIKESGVVVQPSKLHVLLNFIRKSEAAQQCLEQSPDWGTLFEELVIYHDLLCGEGQVSENLYQYPVVLRHYCDTGDTDAAINLLRKIKRMQLLPFEHEKRMQLLSFDYTLIQAIIKEKVHMLLDEIDWPVIRKRKAIKEKQATVSVEHSLQQQLISIREVDKRLPYTQLYAQEWEVEPGLPQFGKGDLVFKRPGFEEYLVVETKYITDNTGRVAITNRKRSRKKVLEQARRYGAALQRRYPEADVKIATYTNESGLCMLASKRR